MLAHHMLVTPASHLREPFGPIEQREDRVSQARLVEALRRHRNLPLPNLLASLVDTVRSFSPHEQHDDITLLVAKCK